MQIQALAVNNIYPFSIRPGASTNFLSKGNLLKIALQDISAEEILAFKKHPIKCGILIDLPVILWLFDFGIGGQYDAPFDIRLYDKNERDLFNIENKEQRLLIELHVVELNNNLLKVLRAFTLPHELTLKCLSATQDQLAMVYDKNLYDQKLNQIYQSSIDDLLAKTKLYKGGT